MSIILRDYQALDLSHLRSELKQVRRVCYVLPTGGGKTAVASYMLHGAAQRGIDSFFVVHRKELAYQTSEALQNYGIPHGIVAAGERLEPWHHIQLVLIGSLKSRMKYLRKPKLIVPDEAHHARAAMWDEMFAMFPDAKNVGLTATPQRLDGKGLGKHYDRLVIGPEMRWLIDKGYLADYRLFMPPPIKRIEDVHTVAGEFNTAELRAVLEDSTIVGDAITEYTKHSPHKQAIVRSIDIGFSIDVAQRFRDAGYKAVHIDGTFDKTTRRNIFRDYKRGDIEVLSQVELAGEGVDVPGIIVGIDLRPSKSLTSTKQFWGRCLRMFDGKGKATLLDHAGNAALHGFPDDVIDWSLEDRKSKRPTPKLFSCDECFAIFSERHAFCPECGARMGPQPGMGGGRLHPEQIDGSLSEVTAEEKAAKRAADAAARAIEQAKNKAKFDKKRELRAATTLEELQALAEKKGYKPGWAQHIFDARQRTIEKYRGGRGRVYED